MQTLNEIYRQIEQLPELKTMPTIPSGTKDRNTYIKNRARDIVINELAKRIAEDYDETETGIPATSIAIGMKQSRTQRSWLHPDSVIFTFNIFVVVVFKLGNFDTSFEFQMTYCDIIMNQKKDDTDPDKFKIFIPGCQDYPLAKFLKEQIDNKPLATFQFYNFLQDPQTTTKGLTTFQHSDTKP